MGTIPATPTFAVGEKLAASKLTQLKTAIDFWSLTPRCYAYQSTLQTLTSATWTTVTLNNEVYDIVQSGDTPSHDIATDNSRVYARTAGKYEVVASATIAQNGTGARGLRIIKNGSTGTIYGYTSTGSQAGANMTVTTPTVEMVLAAGDYVEMQAFQQAGVNLDTVPGIGSTLLRIKLTGS